MKNTEKKWKPTSPLLNTKSKKSKTKEKLNGLNIWNNKTWSEKLNINKKSWRNYRNKRKEKKERLKKKHWEKKKNNNKKKVSSEKKLNWLTNWSSIAKTPWEEINKKLKIRKKNKRKILMKFWMINNLRKTDAKRWSPRKTWSKTFSQELQRARRTKNNKRRPKNHKKNKRMLNNQFTTLLPS